MKQYHEALSFLSYRLRTEFVLFCPISTCNPAVFHNFVRQIAFISDQDDRSTHVLCTTNYRIEHIIKRFHEQNSIMPGLFSQNNLLLYHMQGNNNGHIVKTIKNSQNHLFGQPVLTFDKH